MPKMVRGAKAVVRNLVYGGPDSLGVTLTIKENKRFTRCWNKYRRQIRTGEVEFPETYEDSIVGVKKILDSQKNP